jgi:DNA polymerase-3 subunit beta
MTTKSTTQVLTVPSKELHGVLKSFGPAVYASSPKVRMTDGKNGLRLQASNGTFAAEAVIKADGRSKGLDHLLEHKALLRLIAAAGPQVSLTLDDGHLEIRSGNRTLKLQARDSSDFHQPPKLGSPVALATIEGQKLQEELSRAIICTAPDDIRPVLQSVAMVERDGTLALVATDSYRLALLSLGVKPSQELDSPLLLPKDLVKALIADLKRVKPEEVVVEIGDLPGGKSGVSFSYRSIVWVTETVQGTFPDYTKIIPEGGDELVLDADELREALSGIKALISGNGKGNSQPLKLTLGEEIEISFEKIDVGILEERLPESTWPGQEMSVGLNPVFTSDLLRVINDQDNEIRGRVVSPLKPLVFSDQDSRSYLLMPIRLAD